MTFLISSAIINGFDLIEDLVQPSDFCPGGDNEYWQDFVCPTYGLLPWTTFMRILDRISGSRRVLTFSCAEHYRVMAFAQLTYRESLREIEASLSAQAHKLALKA